MTPTYDAHQQTAQTQITFAGDVPVTASAIQATQERVKVSCFLVQRAVWTAHKPSSLALNTVTVVVQGMALDDDGDKVVSGYGGAELTVATSKRFDWAALTADSAWNRYDAVLLAPDYAPFHTYG
ncbi:MAG: hypothetical protein ABI274_11605 [Ktedonobacterales bacterium]